MLPRARFVFAALVIAVLPWLLLGSGAVIRSHDAAVPREITYAHGTLLQQAMIDANESWQLQALTYARRSEELDRLRALASAPLQNWLDSPAGDRPADAAVLPANAAAVTVATAPAVATPPIAAAPLTDAPPATAMRPDADAVRSAKPPETALAPERTADKAPEGAPAAAARAETQPPAPVQQASIDPATTAAQTGREPAPVASESTPPALSTPPQATRPDSAGTAPAAVIGSAEESVQVEPIPLPQARPLMRKKLGAIRKRLRQVAGNRPARAPANSDNPFDGLFNFP